MADYIVVSVRDSVVGAYGRPAFVPSPGAAIRSFCDEVNRQVPDNQMAQHPDDFDLYILGVFDDATGLFSCHPPELLAQGAKVVLSRE